MMIFMQQRFTEADIPILAGKTAIVTGANSGLGFEIAKTLANRGARVVLACRDESKAKTAADEIRKGNPSADVMVRSLDLASLASIDTYVAQFLTAETKLDLLINNAGLMAIDESRTVDGFEMQLGVNHLGHFALTAMLMPVLLSTPQSRVVSMSSSAHRKGKMDFDDLMFERRPYSRWSAYAQSKLANLLFILELNRRLGASSQTKALAAHPGVANTNLGQNAGGIIGFGFRISAPLIAHSALKGAMPALRAASDPDAKGGQFYGPRYMMVGSPVVETPSLQARNLEDAQRLWKISEELTGKHLL